MCVEQVKCVFSDFGSISLQVEWGDCYYEMMFDEVGFESICVLLLVCLCVLVQCVFVDVVILLEEFDNVVLVGGVICMFIVCKMIVCMFGCFFVIDFNLDEVVVFGVVVQVGLKLCD